jgi:hypothetical protein
MKPIQIGLLVVVGAIGGALVMKVTERAKAPEVAQSQPAAPVAAPVQPASPPASVPPEAAPPAATPEPERPSPVAVPAKRQTSKVPVVNVRVPVVQARKNPPPPVQPEPVKPEPAPEVASAPVIPPPPARTEPENVTPAPQPPEPHTVTLNAGMLLPVRLVDGLSSERNLPGDTFTATLDKELVMDGFVIAERGARVDGKVVAADRGGRVKGVAAIAVELTRLRTSDGQNIAVQTDSFERHAEETHTQDAAKVGGGAALGAIIGAIAGGGKGAAVGAAAGGAAGAGGVLLTRGKEARLPSETRISFRLRSPVIITERR